VARTKVVAPRKIPGRERKDSIFKWTHKEEEEEFQKGAKKNKDEARSCVAGAFTGDGGGNGVVGRR
jgi:hypothetical protein